MSFSTLFADPVALFATLSVVGAVVIFVFLAIKLKKLMDTTHSDD